ncbi:MAG TPA: VCBS repeat-containing protein, partial [Polyangiales bacterium]|nr:VCBS repeat-containing protein [Polyangiales bacterium]
MRWTLCMLALAGCANLPELERSVCGNAIQEDGEDCDGFAFDGASRCRPPGEDGACHFDCAATNGSARWTCMPGWGCDADDLCRKPSGAFLPKVEYSIGAIESLSAGDFDGDGRTDLLSRNPRDLSGRATISFHYFDARAALVETRPFRKLMMAPVIGRLTDDGRDDLVFSDFRVGVMLGRGDRTWTPEAFTPYVLPAGLARVTGLRQGYVSKASSLASVATLSDGPGVYVPNVDTNSTALRAPISVPLDSLLGDPLPVDIGEGPSSPCQELVLAFRGQTTFMAVEMCSPESLEGAVTWLPSAQVSTIALDPPAPLDQPPVAGDLNSDGHLDVLVGAGGLTYAAFGDGVQLSTATPFRPASGEDGALVEKFSMPLAVGDLSGDGAPDFIMADSILLSQTPSGATKPQYNVGWINSIGRWTAARIADLNGNGYLDAVAAERGRLHVDFFNGSGHPWLLESKILSARPVGQLTIGDFDGDLIQDLALVEQAASEQELDTVKVAFGALSQAPLEPQAVARARSVKQLGVFREAGTDTVLVVADHPDPSDNRNLTYLLGGNAERIPFAALELLLFSPEGMLGNVVSTELVLGSFSAPASKDALALGFDQFGRNWQFWLVPNVDRPSPSPSPLVGVLDARLAPSAVGNATLQFPAAEIYAVGTAGDLNRDGRDESIWVMPADGTRCGVEIFSMAERTMVSGGLIVLDSPCPHAQIAAVNADEDGYLDLVLLTGKRGDPDRKLYVLWNDGAGRFASER